MSPEQNAQLGRLFDELVDLSPSQRQSALDAVADPLVRQELESLLQHTGDDQTSLESSVGGILRAAAAAGSFGHTGIRPGTRFSHYRIVGKLGQGGMGDVYEAMREEGFQQRVALKVLRAGMESDFARKRFDQERHFLASLEHPYIARLLDGGANEHGSPFLVLEFVEGTPVDQFAQNLSRPQILQLFLKICDAVDYAHHRLIIHRDLKPANILVTADGTPKLLDFGIAKFDSPDAGVTRTQFQALTPQYASPEQIRNDAVTTASDVYSLGLILYELLTRRRPYNVASASSLLQAHQIVTETEPAKPALSGDLDTILLMALRKDPARRYQSVREFAADISRSLEDRPVLARPDSFSYRAGKFLRRNRFTAAAAAALFLAVAAGVSVSLYQANLAQQRFEQVRRLAHTFVFDIHDEIAKVDGTTAARELVVKTALDYLDQLRQSAGDDLALREELANAYVKVANAQGVPGEPNLGHLADAAKNYDKAALLFESVAAANPQKRPALGRFYYRHARVKQYTGDTGGAVARATQALQILEPVAKSPTAPLELRIDYAHVLSILGEFQLNGAQIDQSVALADSILAQTRNRETLLMANQVYARGSSISLLGRITDSINTRRKQDAVLAELLSLEPANPILRRSRAVNYQDLSVAYFDDAAISLNDPANALRYAKLYLQSAQTAAAADPKNSAARFSEAIAFSRVATPERFLDPPAAVAHARTALQTLESLQAARPSFFNASRIPRLRRILADALVANKQIAPALELIRRSVSESRALMQNQPSDGSLRFQLALSLHSLGAAELAAANPAAAIPALNEARATLEPDTTATQPYLQYHKLYTRILTALATAQPSQSAALKARAAKMWAEYRPDNEFVLSMRNRQL